MSTPPGAIPADRIRVPDPAAMRRGARRTVLATAIVLLLLTGFTAGGITMLTLGELPAVPFAVGGATAQLAAIALAVTALRVRSTLHGDTVSRPALLAAHRTFTVIRAAVLTVAAALVAYAAARLILGDPWTMLTTAIIGLPLGLLARGATRLRHGATTTLNQPTR
jgi:hypothetical protein